MLMFTVQYNNSQLIHDWNLTCDRLKNLTSVLSKLIDIRDGYKKCDGLACDICFLFSFILELCTNHLLCCIIVFYNY